MHSCAIERLKKEGKVYHRPELLHYVALYLSGKKTFAELTRGDVEKARDYIAKAFKPYLELRVPMYRLHKLFPERFADMYVKLPKAPKSYQAVAKLIKAAVGTVH